MSSERDPRNIQQDNAIFDEMMEQFQRHEDIGIAEFEDSVREVRDRLVAKYISIDETDDGMDIVLDDDEMVARDSIYEEEMEEEIRDAIDDLSGEWMHEGDLVTVTGRIYTSDDFKNNFIPPKEWGKESFDELSGYEYFTVQGVTLRSAGMDIVSLRDKESDALLDIRGTYDFTMPNDEEEKVVVFAYIGDLISHTYETPTPKEAISYLEAHHREACTLIHKAITPDGETTLPVRLQSLVHELQSQLAESDKFAKSVEQYVQHFMNFSPKESYKLIIEDYLQLFDGSNITIQGDDAAMWPRYSFDSPLVINEVSLPLVKFIKEEDGSVGCYLQVLRFNDEKGDEDPEFVRVSIDSVASFRSNRAARPLLSWLEYDKAGLASVNPDLFDIDTDESEGEQSLRSEEDVVSESFTSFIVGEVENFESELKNVTEKVARARKRLYQTYEEAIAAGRLFVQNEMAELFRLFELSAYYKMMVSGEGVSRNNIEKNVTSASEEHAGMYNLSLTFNSEEPFIELEPGEVRPGMMREPFLGIERVNDDSYVNEQYRINPTLILSDQLDTETLSMIHGVEFLAAAFPSAMLVRLDGSAEITIPFLDDYRDSKAKIDTLETVENLANVIDLLQNLQDTVIKAISDKDYIPFNHVELFDMLDKITKDKDLGKEVASAAIGAAESVIMEKRVKVRGEMLVRDIDSGRYITYTKGESDALLPGKIMDIRSDIDGDDLFLVIHDDIEDVIVSIRMSTITELRF